MPPTSKADTERALGSAGTWALSGSQETNAWEVSGTLEMGPRVLSALSITLPTLPTAPLLPTIDCHLKPRLSLLSLG